MLMGFMMGSDDGLDVDALGVHNAGCECDDTD